MPEGMNYQDIDPSTLDIDRLEQAHQIRQTGRAGKMAGMIEDEVFQEAMSKTAELKQTEGAETLEAAEKPVNEGELVVANAIEMAQMIATMPPREGESAHDHWFRINTALRTSVDRLRAQYPQPQSESASRFK